MNIASICRLILSGILILALAEFSASYAADSTSLLSRAEQNIENGKLAARASQYDEALAAFTSAIDSKTLSSEKLADAYSRRARTRETQILHMTLGYEGGRDSSLILVLQDSSYARRLDPERLDAILTEGEAFVYLGAYEEAKRTYEDAAVVDKPFPRWSFLQLGSLHTVLGNYDAAIAYYDQVIDDWGPNSGMPPHYKKTRALYKAGRYQDAIEEISRGIPLQPDYPWALAYRACSFAQLGKFREALEDYDATIRITESLSAEVRESPTNKEDFLRIANERKAVQVLAKGETSPIPLAKFCAIREVGDEKRERSGLLTPEILATIEASDKLARVAEAAEAQKQSP